MIKAISIPCGLGDLIFISAQLNSIKNTINGMDIAFNSGVLNTIDRGPEYIEFITKIFHKLFDKKFKLVPFADQPMRSCENLCNIDMILPVHPRLRNVFCSPVVNEYGPYICLTTKIRQMDRSHFNKIKEQYFKILNKYSEKFKFMILGERSVEYNSETAWYTDQYIYSIYDELIKELPKDRIIDKTVPALGVTVPNIDKLFEDFSLIGAGYYSVGMSIGGPFCSAVAIGNAVWYRVDDDFVADYLYVDSVSYPDLYVTKNFPKFLAKLDECLGRPI